MSGTEMGFRVRENRNKRLFLYFGLEIIKYSFNPPKIYFLLLKLLKRVIIYHKKFVFVDLMIKFALTIVVITVVMTDITRVSLT